MCVAYCFGQERDVVGAQAVLECKDRRWWREIGAARSQLGEVSVKVGMQVLDQLTRACACNVLQSDSPLCFPSP
nr:hypothetical protein GCM10025699_56460 [Microbacterium flavescens]